MSSPSTATDYASSRLASPQPPPSSKPSVRFQEDETPTTTTTSSHDINTGISRTSRARVPLADQAANRRQHVALISVQLAVVTIGVLLLEHIAPGWLDSPNADINVVLPLSISLAMLLVVLHFVRDKFPFNYAVLALLTAALVVTLAALDFVLASNILLLNCGFAVVFSMVMALTAGWTSPRKASMTSCSGLSFRWTPPPTAPLGVKDDSHRRLMTPYMTGFLAFAVACGTLAATLYIKTTIEASGDALIISFFAQIIVCCWLVYQIRTVSKSRTSDAYKNGVVYLYADILAML